MIIQLHPQRRTEPLRLAVVGDTLHINSVAFDFSPLPDGAVLPRAAVGCEFIVGDIRRESGELRVPLIFPIGPYASASACFPALLTVRQDGPVALPPPGFVESDQ